MVREAPVDGDSQLAFDVIATIWVRGGHFFCAFMILKTKSMIVMISIRKANNSLYVTIVSPPFKKNESSNQESQPPTI